MDKLKHNLSFKSKHSLLQNASAIRYDKGMLKKLPTPEQIALGKRVKEAIATLGRGGKRDVANRCGVSEQAVTGWEKTGRISKERITVISEMTGYNTDWLISGIGKKLATNERDAAVKQTTNFVIVDSVKLREIGQYLVSHDQNLEIKKMLLIDDGDLDIKKDEAILSVRVESSREDPKPHYFLFSRDRKHFEHDDIVLVTFGDDENFHIMRYQKYGDIARFESELNIRQSIDLTDALRFIVHGICVHIQPVGRKPRRH